MANVIRQSFSVPFAFDVIFTRGVFEASNDALFKALEPRTPGDSARAMFVVDSGVAACHPEMIEQIESYCIGRDIESAGEPLIVPGGERCKNETQWLDVVVREIDQRGVCRHSYVVAVGGGAVLDMAGYAAAIAHRGVRHMRIPTTTLAQGDSAVGVKNGVNAFGKKNFVGAFVPPSAVIMDAEFLMTLHDRDWRSGISEAIKVALLKDAEYFAWLERSMDRLNARDLDAMEKLIRRSAELHLNHIATSGDPFELGSSRPLDFGHWSAHRLESMSNHELRHGEAVAIGLALDLTYSKLVGMLEGADWRRAVNALSAAGFELFSPLLIDEGGNVSPELMRGLDEFREHLGGELTIMLLESIGSGVEAHEMDFELVNKAVAMLRERALAEEMS